MPDNSKPLEGAELYRVVATMVLDHMESHQGEAFSFDDMCRWIGTGPNSEARKCVSDCLRRQAVKGTLEKDKTTRGSLYRYVCRDKKHIDWVSAVPDDELPIRWPRARAKGDATVFEFHNRISVRPNDLIVISGASNSGKSTFARNFMAENIDAWDGKIQMMVNEFSPGRFKTTIQRMNWVSMVYDDGSPRFELIERTEDWQDIIQPDGINIIDWIGLGDNFYRIRTVLGSIQSKLNGGIAMVMLQKSKDKQYGEGGGFGEHLAAVYLSIDFGRLTVMKIKEPKGGNDLIGKVYGFDIVDGAAFSNIRRVVPCTKCSGRFGKTAGCDTCQGTGFVSLTAIRAPFPEDERVRQGYFGD